MGRASCYDALDERKSVIEDYTKVIFLDPQRASAWNNRCWARAIVGDLEESLNDCNQSLELRPNDPETLDSRGLVYLKLRNPPAAIQDYDTALKLNSRMPTSLYGRGLAKFETGQKAAADQDIAAARKIEPHISELFARLGVAVNSTDER